MSKTYQQLLEEARKLVPELSIDQVRAAVAGSKPPIVVDVREKEEYREGHLPGAISIPRGFLEMQIEGKVDDKDQPVIAYCQSGIRSLFAAKAMKDMGYRDVRSMTGGYGAWQGAGYSWDKPFKFKAEQLER